MENKIYTQEEELLIKGAQIMDRIDFRNKIYLILDYELKTLIEEMEKEAGAL